MRGAYGKRNYTQLKIQGAKANQVADCMSDAGILPPTTKNYPHDEFTVEATSNGNIKVVGLQDWNPVVGLFSDAEPGRAPAIAVTPHIEAAGPTAENIIKKVRGCISKVAPFTP